jgi:hypothetical protein
MPRKTITKSYLDFIAILMGYAWLTRHIHRLEKQELIKVHKTYKIVI